ncbi:MAG: GFA family protein [Rhodobacter sp.]|nr:GFA family protein [Rhodobacter sp.]
MQGRCLCGAVIVSAELARRSLSACHCDMCRQWTSSAFMAIDAKVGSVQVEGPVKVFQSSDWAERAFCEVCGSNLWYRITAEGPGHGQHQLAAGLFDVNGMYLGLEVFIDSKPDAYAFEGERRQMTGEEIVAYFAPKEDGA